MAARTKTKKKRVKDWENIWYVEAYEHARAGLSDPQIAEMLGITKERLKRLQDKRPTLREAIQRGREIWNTNESGGFQEYVYQQLSPEMKMLWDKICDLGREGNAITRIEALLQKNGKLARQRLFIHALSSSNFNVSQALKRVNTSYNTFKRWAQEPGFVELLDEMEFHKKNFLESALMRSVKDGETAAVLFANRTKNRDRGYDTKQVIEHTGTINHKHTFEIISPDDIDIPLELKKQLLSVLEKRQQEADALYGVAVVEEPKRLGHTPAAKLKDFENDDDEIIDVDVDEDPELVQVRPKRRKLKAK